MVTFGLPISVLNRQPMAGGGIPNLMAAGLVIKRPFCLRQQGTEVIERSLSPADCLWLYLGAFRARFSREEANPPVFEQLRRVVCVAAFHGRG